MECRVQRLPSLCEGVNLLRPDKQKKEALASLVLDYLIRNKGKTVWIDSCNYASTHLMHRLTPDPRLLDKIEVARAFTPYQHFSLIENLIDKIDRDTSLVVAPVFDYLYSDSARWEGKKMAMSAIEYIDDVVDQYNIPVLLTESGTYTSIIKDYIEETIECRTTSMGARFLGSNFETLVYPKNGGIQTTLELWRLILEKTYNIDIHQKKQVKNGVGVYG